MDIDRRILRPEPRVGKDGPVIVYGLVTVEDRSRAMQFASGAPVAPKAKKGKRIRAKGMDAPPSVEIDQDLYGRAVAALVLRSVDGAESGGRPLVWDCDQPLELQVEALAAWPIRWLLKLIRVATEEAELDPEEERGA